MNYAYVAYNENKEIVKGKVEAKTEEQAGHLLDFAGYQIINLREISTFPTMEKLMLRLSTTKPTEIILFFRQMALLIESGMNIVTAIELLQSQASNRVFKKVLEEIIRDVRSGGQLSKALSKHPTIFNAIHCQSIKVGEQTGGMESILRQVADHMEKQVNSRKGVKNAMMYPIIAAVVAVVVVAVMVVFVFPTFESLYSSLGAELPFIAQMMMDMGDALRASGLYILGGLGALVVGGMAYMKTASGRYKWDGIKLKFPIVGRINQLNELARICRNISMLFKAGLPLTEIMPLVIQGTDNKVISEALLKIKDEMLGGEGLSRPMAKQPVFLPMMVQMVRVGEETGNLDATLLSVAQSYEADAEDKTKSMIGMIQPILTIVIGLVVALMALSLVSAMYSMYSSSGF